MQFLDKWLWILRNWTGNLAMSIRMRVEERCWGKLAGLIINSMKSIKKEGYRFWEGCIGEMVITLTERGRRREKRASSWTCGNKSACNTCTNRKLRGWSSREGGHVVLPTRPLTAARLGVLCSCAKEERGSSFCTHSSRKKDDRSDSPRPGKVSTDQSEDLALSKYWTNS